MYGQINQILRQSYLIPWCVEISQEDVSEKKKKSKSYRATINDGNHSTRSSFYGFISSEFRVLVEYFWRSIVIFMHLQKMFCPIVCNIIVVLEADVSDSQLVESDDSDETQIVYK